MNPVYITDHALERLAQRFKVSWDRETLAALLWSYPVVRAGVEIACGGAAAERDMDWGAVIRRENMRAIFRRNTLVTVVPIKGHH